MMSPGDSDVTGDKTCAKKKYKKKKKKKKKSFVIFLLMLNINEYVYHIKSLPLYVSQFLNRNFIYNIYFIYNALTKMST